MSTPLHVLILEDRPADAELILHALRRSGFEPLWRRVETEAEYLGGLDTDPDLILADYALPQFDGIRALELLQARGLDIPFIIVSGTIGEEIAVAAMRQGAYDYLLKDRLARLGTAVEHALQQRQLRMERKQAEEALRAERALLAERVEARTTELRIANAELARALRLKDEFLANMSHELRTPLNAVLGHAELLQEELYGPLNSRQKESLHSIETSGWHLLALINDILDLSKIEAGKLEIQPETVDVDLVCQTSLHMVSQSALAKEISLSATIDKQVETIYADERRLKQILVNLLSNAIKFTPEGGKVGLEVQGNQAQQAVSFTVWDTGIGIAETDRSKLFQPFTQIDSGLSRQYGGTGLGLSLVLRLAQAHGGSVRMESTPGQGSRFTVILPWLPASDQATDSGASSDLSPEPSAHMEPSRDEPRASILVVDDNEANSEVIADYLMGNGYAVRVAGNGVEALAMAQASPPAAVLMDIQMPGMDGLETTRRMRADPRLQGMAIIALTALAMPGDRERCLAAGADAYLTKPVGMRALLATLEAHLKTIER